MERSGKRGRFWGFRFLAYEVTVAWEIPSFQAKQGSDIDLIFKKMYKEILIVENRLFSMCAGMRTALSSEMPAYRVFIKKEFF